MSTELRIFPDLILMVSQSVLLVLKLIFMRIVWQSEVSLKCPYQGLFIDFGFLGRISYDKEGKAIPSSQEDIEEINRETAWILISDAETKMYYCYTWLSKASLIKYLGSFLEEYSPNVSKKICGSWSRRWIVSQSQGAKTILMVQVQSFPHRSRCFFSERSCWTWASNCHYKCLCIIV